MAYHLLSDFDPSLFRNSCIDRPSFSLLTMCEPLHEDVFHIKRSALAECDSLAGIDRGCSLTKIAYVKKDEPQDEDVVVLRCATFLNAHFEEALQFMKEHAVLPPHGKLHMTGAGGDLYKTKIKAVLDMELVFIDEFLTQARGVHFLLNHGVRSEVLHPEMSETVNDEGPLLPTAFLQIGSGCGIVLILESGLSFMVGGSHFSGKMFLGLSRLLLGTDSYQEIIELVENGDRKALSLLASEAPPEIADSFGPGVQNLPLVSFGRDSTTEAGLEGCSKEDVAASLAWLFTSAINHVTNNLIRRFQSKGITNVCVGGNFARGKVIRDFFMEANKHTLVEKNLVFLTTGHTGAIGAMISQPEDVEKYFSVKPLI